MVVELLDEEAEHHEVDQNLERAQHEHEGHPVGLVGVGDVGDDAGEQVGVPQGGHVQDLEKGHEGAGDDRVEEVEQGRGKDEHEVNGLGDGGQGGGDDQGNDGGGHPLAVLRIGGVDERAADADIAEHLGEADGHIIDAVGEALDGHVHLRHDNGVSAHNGGLAHLEHAAHVGELEGGVHQMMQAGGQQQPLQEAVEEDAEGAGVLDDAAQGADPALNHRPDVVGKQGEEDGHKDQADEGEVGAGVDLQRALEALLIGAVEHVAHHAAQDDAAEHAHVHALHAQDLGLAGAEQAQHGGLLGQGAGEGEQSVGADEVHEVGHKADEGGLMLLVLGQRGGDADDKDHAEVVDDAHHGVVDQLAQGLDGAPLEEGQHAGDGRIGEQHAHHNEDARRGQVHQRLHHGLGEFLQSAHDTFFHSLFLLRSLIEVKDNLCSPGPAPRASGAGPGDCPYEKSEHLGQMDQQVELLLLVEGVAEGGAAVLVQTVQTDPVPGVVADEQLIHVLHALVLPALALEDALGQEFQVGDEAHGVQAVRVQGHAVGLLDDVQGALDELQDVVGRVLVHRDGDEVQGDIARLVLRQGHAAAFPDDVQRPAAQVKLPAVEEPGLTQKQVGQAHAAALALNGEADVVYQGDGGLVAHGEAVRLRGGDDPLGGLHHVGPHVLEHLEELGLHLVLDIVDLLHQILADPVPGPLVEADPPPQHNGLPAVGHHGGDGIVIENLDGTHTNTSSHLRAK